MNLTLGYLKDYMAVYLFAIGIILVFVVKDTRILKPILLIGFLMGFILDGIFSYYPELHNMEYRVFLAKYLV
jgi:hypothetical protein